MKWFYRKRYTAHTRWSFLAISSLLSLLVLGITLSLSYEIAINQGMHDGYACGFSVGREDRIIGNKYSTPSHRMYFPDDYFLSSGLFTTRFDYYYGFAFVISEGYSDGYHGKDYNEKYCYPFRITIY